MKCTHIRWYEPKFSPMVRHSSDFFNLPLQSFKASFNHRQTTPALFPKSWPKHGYVKTSLRFLFILAIPVCYTGKYTGVYLAHVTPRRDPENHETWCTRDTICGRILLTLVVYFLGILLLGFISCTPTQLFLYPCSFLGFVTYTHMVYMGVFFSVRCDREACQLSTWACSSTVCLFKHQNTPELLHLALVVLYLTCGTKWIIKY